MLTEYAGWRWCLYVNVLVAGRRCSPVAGGCCRATTATRCPVDVVSGVLATAGLAGLVLGAGEAAAHGWASPRCSSPG